MHSWGPSRPGTEPTPHPSRSGVPWLSRVHPVGHPAFNPPDPDRNIQLHRTETSKLANHQERPGSWSSPALGTRLLFPSNDHAPPFRVPLETNRSV